MRKVVYAHLIPRVMHEGLVFFRKVLWYSFTVMSLLPSQPIPVSPSNKKAKKIAKIVVDRDLCIGAASCVVVYSDVFELDSENKAVIKKKDGTNDSGPVLRTELNVAHIDDETLLLAAQSCPTLAIFLYDEDDNLVYPTN